MNKIKIIFIVLVVATALSMFEDYTVISYTLAFLVVASIPGVFFNKAHHIDIFDPHLVLSVLLYLYSVSTLLYVETFGQTYYKETVTIDEINSYIYCCLLGIVGLSVGKIFSLVNLSTSTYKLQKFEDLHRRARKIIVGLGGFFFIAFIYFMKDKFMPWAATNYADTALAVRVLSLNDQAAGIKEIATETIPLFFVLGGSTVLVLTKQKVSLLLRLVAFLLLASYIVTMMLSGWRSQMMGAVVMIAIYYHYTHKQLHLRSVVVGSILVYALINFLSIMRGSSNPIEMIVLLAEAFQERGMDILAISQSGELATSTNLIRLISGINNNEINFGYGSIAVDQIIALIPRAIMPDRPPIASERFVQTFYPGIYENGGGYGFFILQDGYWDFGFIGVLIYSFVFSVMTQKIYKFYLYRVRHPFWTLFYGLVFYTLVFSSIRSGIFASIKSTLIVALPVLLIYGLTIFVTAPTNNKKDQQ